MAVTTLPTFTPSGYLEFATAQDPGSSTTFTGITVTNPRAVPTAAALPVGSSPASVLIENLGPEPAILTIAAAAATTTGTAASGGTALTVASATSIAVGQVVVGAGIQPGTLVQAIVGLVVTLTLPTTAALSSTAVNFVAAVSLTTGVAAAPSVPLVLGYVSSGFICALCLNSARSSVLNVAVGI
jgi:hypothetical protein